MTIRFDDIGNRLTRDDSAEGLTTYDYDDNDRLIEEITAGLASVYTYDDNGVLPVSVHEPFSRIRYLGGLHISGGRRWRVGINARCRRSWRGDGID